MACYKAVQTDGASCLREREITLSLPASARQRQQFTHAPGNLMLRVTCVMCFEYQNHCHLVPDPFLLDKLDVVLDAGTLEIEYCASRINGLDNVTSFLWLADPLRNVLNRCDLHMTESSAGAVCSQCFRFYSSKASAVNTPLAYLLKRPVPHAKLTKMYMMLEWTTDKPHRWTDLLQEPDNVFNDYLETVLIQIFSGRLGPAYPLIFSLEYARKLGELTRFLPSMARSMQRVVTRRAEDPTTTTSIAMANIQAMISRTRVFKPMQDADDDVWVQLVVSLYDNVKRMTGLQKYTKMAETTTPSSTEVSPYDSLGDVWTEDAS